MRSLGQILPYYSSVSLIRLPNQSVHDIRHGGHGYDNAHGKASESAAGESIRVPADGFFAVQRNG
jgi:hypothetical protein